jgi:hypothetical protein
MADQANLDASGAATVKQDDIRFHSERAKAELDLADRAASAHVAKAHRDLAALHLDRMRSLNEALS